MGSDLKNYIAIFYQGLEEVKCFQEDIAKRGFTNTDANLPNDLSGNIGERFMNINCPK